MNSPLDPRRNELLDCQVVEVLKKKTPAEKLAIAIDSSRMVRLRLGAHFQMTNPDWTKAQIDAAVAMIVLNGTG